MEINWDTNKILSILPQRHPFLFIDKVLTSDSEKRFIRCVKNVSGNEHFLQGHFPGNPILPGVIIIETMAQASILLFSIVKPDISSKKPNYFLGKVEAKFIHPVKAGDQLIVESTADKIIDTGGMVLAKAFVGELLVSEATIFFGVKTN